MKQKIRMIGLDMDGTLLTSDKKITAYTMQVLEKAMEQGIEIVLSTGRAVTGIAKEILEIPGFNYIVSINGARIIDLRTQEIIYESALPIEKALQILDIIGEYDAIQEAFIDSVCYADKAIIPRMSEFFLNPGSVEYILKSRTPVEDVKAVVRQINMPVDKVNGVFKTPEDKKSVYEKLTKVPGVVVVSSFRNNWEINAEGTDKGNALLRLGKHLGIRREEIMACGDSLNDMAMIKAVGLGVAMGNADPQVKEIADYVTVSNNEDGVAKAIEKFALES